MKNKLFSKIPEDKLERYLDGSLDEQETARIDAMLDEDPALQLLVDDYVNMQMAANNEDLQAAKKHSKRLRLIRITVAAASVAVIAVGSWLFCRPDSNTPTCSPLPIYRGTDSIFDLQPDSIAQDTIDTLL